MTQTQGDVAQAGATEAQFDYPATIEEAGPATKKITVDIPAQQIAKKLDEQFRDLRREALVPGFRVGHAPRKLVEKRFNQDVRAQVCRNLLAESYSQVLEKHNFKVVGEPDFQGVKDLKLPEQGNLSYTFQVEVQPDIILPELMNLKVKKIKAQVTDANLEAGMTNLREQAGTLTPVEDRGVQSGDYLIADVHLKLGDEVIGHSHSAQFPARPGRLGGIQIDDLDKKLEGMKPEETRVLEVHVPANAADDRIKDKDVKIEILLHEIKQMRLADIDAAMLEDLGFKSEQELREALKVQMELRVGADVRADMQEQVRRYLLENTQFELPAQLTERQTDRMVSRRAIDLMLRGLQREQAMASAERLRGESHDDAVRALKLYFILEKIASDREIDATEAELNGQIAVLASQRGERPEKLKQDLAANGRLQDIYLNIREIKTLNNILESAQIEEVEPEQK